MLLRESGASTYEEVIELWRGYIEALHAMLIECQFLLKVHSGATGGTSSLEGPARSRENNEEIFNFT